MFAWSSFAKCLPSRFAAAALSFLIHVSTLTRMGRGGFFLCSFFFLGLPRCLDTSIMSSSGSVCCFFAVSFDLCKRLRRTPVQAYCFVASRACFTAHLDRRWTAGMSFGVAELSNVTIIPSSLLELLC